MLEARPGMVPWSVGPLRPLGQIDKCTGRLKQYPGVCTSPLVRASSCLTALRVD